MEKQPIYWRDPMYPQHRFDKPGKSPFMDMMLVPVYADDGAAQNGVTIDPRMVQNLGVRTAEVKRGALKRTLRLVGAVAFDERAVALVQARVNGYVERLYVRAPLDRVRRGEPLAELLAPDWVAAQEEYLALRRAPQASAALREGARQRLVLLGVDEATIAALEFDGKVRSRVVLTAPVSGVVGELAVGFGGHDAVQD
jgi:Cu(I)/Ag(I) efflux system membrane fusion protein